MQRGHVLLLFRHSSMSDSETSWTIAGQASLSFNISLVCSDSCPLSQWSHPIVSYLNYISLLNLKESGIKDRNLTATTKPKFLRLTFFESLVDRKRKNRLQNINIFWAFVHQRFCRVISLFGQLNLLMVLQMRSEKSYEEKSYLR